MRRWTGVLASVALALTSAAASAVGAPAPLQAGAAACVVTPLQTTPFPGALRALPWIMASPRSAGITGHLFYGRGKRGRAAALHPHGRMPDGGATKILWVILPAGVAPSLAIDGRNLTGQGRTHQVVPAASGGGLPGTLYPSIIDVPTAGCWRFHLHSGYVAGTVTLRVVPSR